MHGRRVGNRRRIALAALALAACWSLGALAHTASTSRVYTIPTNSMAPALLPGDRVQAEEGGAADPRRGEVWILRAPAAAGLPGAILVKRVVGLPGETIEVRGGRTLADGRALVEPYLAAPPTYTMPPRTLGPDEYLVLGDGRDASHDGHVWGAANRRHLLGRVRMRLWPIRRMGGL